MKNLSLNLPGSQQITSQTTIPSGGLNVVNEAFQNGFTILLIVVVILSIIFIIIAGIKWISSGGNKNKVSAARKNLTWAIVGLSVAFSSFFIVNMIGHFFGTPLTGTNQRPPITNSPTETVTVQPTVYTTQPVTQAPTDNTCLDGKTVRYNVRACGTGLACHPFTPFNERFCRLPDGTCNFFCTDK